GRLSRVGRGRLDAAGQVIASCNSRDLHLIALPTSDGGSIAPAAWRCSPQSAAPRPAPTISPPIFAPAHPRNRHTQAPVRWDRGRRNTLIAPRQTRAAGSDARLTQQSSL